MRELTSQFNYRDNRWRIRSLFKITRNNYARCIIDSTTFRFEPEIEQSQEQSGEFDYSRMDEKETISSQKKKECISNVLEYYTFLSFYFFFFHDFAEKESFTTIYIGFHRGISRNNSRGREPPLLFSILLSSFLLVS